MHDPVQYFKIFNNGRTVILGPMHLKTTPHTIPTICRYPDSGGTCPYSNLFGENLNTDFADMYSGIYWRSFGGPRQSLNEVRMTIMTADFDPNLSIQSSDQDEEYDIFDRTSQNAMYRYGQRNPNESCTPQTDYRVTSYWVAI